MVYVSGKNWREVSKMVAGCSRIGDPGETEMDRKIELTTPTSWLIEFNIASERAADGLTRGVSKPIIKLGVQKLTSCWQ